MITAIAGTTLAIAGAAATFRMLRGPSLADRVAALDVGLMALMSAAALGATAAGSDVALVVLVVIAMVGFTTTVATSRFIERRGPDQ